MPSRSWPTFRPQTGPAEALASTPPLATRWPRAVPLPGEPSRTLQARTGEPDLDLDPPQGRSIDATPEPDPARGRVWVDAAPPRPNCHWLSRRREARPVPQAERLTARVMLDDHVRVDDAHRRRRIPSRDAAHGEAPGVRAVAVAVGAGDEAVCEFVVAERVPPVVVALRSDGRRSAAQCGLHHEQRRSSCELGNEPQGPAATRPQDLSLIHISE